MMYQSALFDLDGTLTNPFLGITRCIQHALRELDLPVPHADELKWCIGPPLLPSFRILLGDEHSHLAEQALVKYRERFATVGLLENELYPDIKETLAPLKDSGCKLFLATAKPIVFARRIMQHFELTGFFEGLYGSELDGTRSNKADLIQYILEERSISPETAVMVGDRDQDVTGAIANHLDCIGVLWGYGGREELETAGASRWVHRPSELTEIIGLR